MARGAAGLAPRATVIAMPARTASLDHLVVDRMRRLAAYQDAAYAARFERSVRDIAAIERERTGGDRVAREVAISLYKLMACKDEYEVARLYAESGFFDRLDQQFEGDWQMRFHLAPPLFARRDAQGHLRKRAYGPWMATAFKWLAKARVLRGTPFDPMGWTAERRGERRAIVAYDTLMREVVDGLDADRVALALELARLPQSVRGYGHVKEHNAGIAGARQDELLARFRSAPSARPLRSAA